MYAAEMEASGTFYKSEPNSLCIVCSAEVFSGPKLN